MKQMPSWHFLVCMDMLILSLQKTLTSSHMVAPRYNLPYLSQLREWTEDKYTYFVSANVRFVLSVLLNSQCILESLFIHS